MNATRICSESDCRSAARGLGLCNLHYKRMRKALGIAQATIKRCKVDGCSKPVNARSMCRPHDRLTRPQPEPQKIDADRPKGRPICKFDGCGRQNHGLGYCKMHYKRLVNNGSPAVVQSRGVTAFPAVDGKKKCIGCQENKPVADFDDRRNKVSPRCKSCMSEYAKRRYAADPLRYISKYWNHRCAGNGPGVSAEELRQRFGVYEWACWMCGEGGTLHIDHVKPRSRGGSHTPANIRPACPACNGRKHDSWYGASRANEFKI